MKLFQLAAAIIVPTLLLIAPSHAHYAGPNVGVVARTVAEASAERDDHAVLLRGRLISKIGDERYLFRDGTGEIEVEIDDEDLPQKTIGADTLIELSGRVDTHRLKATDIDAKWIRAVPMR